VNRGEIWTAAGGVYASKPRPVLIVQDDRFDTTDSVVVVPLTTHIVDAALTHVPIPAGALSGIAQPSYAMVDKITTVRRTNLDTRTGRASAAQVVEIERALLVFLGIAGWRCNQQAPSTARSRRAQRRCRIRRPSRCAPGGFRASPR
jgi:mRNA interferase MazF